MTGGSWPEFLGRIGATGLLYGIHRICRPRPGRHELRARSASGDAHPDGTAPARAPGAVPLNSTCSSGCEDGRHYFVKQGGQWVCDMRGATR